MAFMAGRRIIPVIEEGCKREGIVEFRNAINYNPNDPDETIYSILYALRLKYNPQKIRLHCESCDDYFDGLLPSIEALNKVIEGREKVSIERIRAGVPSEVIEHLPMHFDDIVQEMIDEEKINGKLDKGILYIEKDE